MSNRYYMKIIMSSEGHNLVSKNNYNTNKNNKNNRYSSLEFEEFRKSTTKL